MSKPYTAPNYIVDSRRDQNINLWVSTFKDKDGNQKGVAGYGTTKASAELDLHYQNHDMKI
jgi:hypothetical protein